MVVRRFGVGVLVLGLLGGACWPVAAWASDGPGKKPVRLRPDANELREVLAQQLTPEQWQQMHDEALKRQKDGGALMVGGVLLLAGGIGLTAADFADCDLLVGCHTTAKGIAGPILAVVGVVAEVVGIADVIGGTGRLDQLAAVRPGDGATSTESDAAPVPSVTASPTAPPITLRRTSTPPAGVMTRDEAWRRLHDDAEQKKRSGGRAVVVGVTMATVGAILAAKGHSAHNAAHVRTGFGALIATAGAVSAMVGSGRVSSAERELARLNAMAGVELPLTSSGSRQSVALVAGRAFGIRYRATW